MPGFVTHFIIGNVIFLLGIYLIKKYTDVRFNKKDHILLYLTCIICSIIPDFPLGLYYLLQIGSYNDILHMHILLHYIISPIAVCIFIAGYVIFPTKKAKPILIMGLLCILVHIILDININGIDIWF